MRISDWSSDVCSSDLLAGQWTAGVAGDLLEGSIEAEAGLDRDREQVEGIGQILEDLFVALLRGVVEVDVRREEAEHHQPDHDQDGNRPGGDEDQDEVGRSEERGVGKECVWKCK